MKKLFNKLFILFLIFTFFLPTFAICDDIDEEVIDVSAEIQETSTKSKEIKAPDLNSRSAVIIDRNTNIILYGKNEKTQRKMASTTKIMTATVIIENCNLNETIEISKKAAGTGPYTPRTRPARRARAPPARRRSGLPPGPPPP